MDRSNDVSSIITIDWKLGLLKPAIDIKSLSTHTPMYFHQLFEKISVLSMVSELQDRVSKLWWP
jgi:hypothetical protein